MGLAKRGSNNLPKYPRVNYITWMRKINPVCIYIYVYIHREREREGERERDR